MSLSVLSLRLVVTSSLGTQDGSCTARASLRQLPHISGSATSHTSSSGLIRAILHTGDLQLLGHFDSIFNFQYDTFQIFADFGSFGSLMLL